MLLSDVCLSDVRCLFVAYIGPNSTTERPRKTEIGTEIAYVTHDSDTTFKVKRLKVNLQGRGHIVAASRTAFRDYSSLWHPRWSCASQKNRQLSYDVIGVRTADFSVALTMVNSCVLYRVLFYFIDLFS